MEGVGLGMEVEQRLSGEEGVQRHIFGHSRETGETGDPVASTEIPGQTRMSRDMGTFQHVVEVL